MPPGRFLVVDGEAFDGNGGIIRIDPSSGAQHAVSQDGYFVDPQSMAIARNGTIFVADPNAFDGNGGVIAVNPLTGRQKVVASGGTFVQPVGIAIAPGGRLMVTDREVLAVRKSEQGHRQPEDALRHRQLRQSDRNRGLRGRRDLRRDADFEQYDGGIIQVDARTGEQRTVASGGSFNSPVALAIAASGKLAVVDPPPARAHPRSDGGLAEVGIGRTT